MTNCRTHTLSTRRATVSDSSLYLRLIYTALCLLPLSWLLGVLPPLDALLPWLMEQALTKIMGGSAMATDLRYYVPHSEPPYYIVDMFIYISVALVQSLNGLYSHIHSTNAPQHSSFKDRAARFNITINSRIDHM